MKLKTLSKGDGIYNFIPRHEYSPNNERGVRGYQIVKLVDEYLSSVERKTHPTQNFNINSVLNFVVVKKNPIVVPKHVYDVLECSYTNDPKSKFFVYDKSKRLSTSGKQIRLTLMPMLGKDVSRLPSLDHHFPEEQPHLYESLPYVNLKDFFKVCPVSSKELMQFWISDGGVTKDSRLNSIMKSMILPLEPQITKQNVQRYNNHCMIVTNTGTGKSQFSELLGFKAATGNITEAFLLGGFLDDSRKRVHIGALNGSGTLMLDEYNLSIESSLNKLLRYMENGESPRGIMGDLVCQGTTSIIICGNPKDQDKTLSNKSLPMYFDAFLSQIGGELSMQALGKRYGHLAIGHDYNVADPTIGCKIGWGWVLQSIFYQACREHHKDIRKIFRKFSPWFEQKDDEYRLEMKKTASSIHFPRSRSFITGLGMSPYKLKFATIRSLITDNIGDIVQGNMSDVIKQIKADRDVVYESLKGINIQSARKLSVSSDVDRGTYEYFLEVREYFPDDYGYRRLGSICGVSHQTIKNWIERERKSH